MSMLLAFYNAVQCYITTQQGPVWYGSNIPKIESGLNSLQMQFSFDTIYSKYLNSQFFKNLFATFRLQFCPALDDKT